MNSILPTRSARIVKAALLALIVSLPLPHMAAASCSAPANPIEAENCLVGTPQATWDLPAKDAGDLSIQGFATDISVPVGGTVFFKVNTLARAWRLDIFRLGFYGGNGARLVASVTPSVPLPQSQPACRSEASTGLIDCGNWAVSASWKVPATAVSGVYLAKAIRTDTGGASHIVFVVRNDASRSDIVFQTSDSTWQAYNNYGGNSFYTGPFCNNIGYCRAYKLSYNRPFLTRSVEPQTWLFNAEYPMIRWLEANGYDVAYSTALDGDRNGPLLLNHKIWMSNGHDEYWSGNQRSNVEAARSAGVNLAFFSGNSIYWKTRWENSIDGSNTPYRTLVCYKETWNNDSIDPAGPGTWTGTWRDPRFSPPADGGRPENALAGTLTRIAGGFNSAIQVPQSDGRMRFWRNTSIANLGAGQTATLATGSLGEELDMDEDNGFRPDGLFRLSTTSVTSNQCLFDNGNVVGLCTVNHNMTLYRAASRALVFAAGSYNWAWGLDSRHDRTNVGSTTDNRMQQATVNLFADMGVQPATLRAGLLRATASADLSPPRSTVTSPASGLSFAAGSTVTVTGTAADSGGGVVGGVEVSTDQGATWHPADGRESWSYTWYPRVSGPTTILCRAVDDSGNLEIPSSGAQVLVTGSSLYSIWPPSAAPFNPDGGPDSPVELGLKFKADVSGQVKGIRFYKASANTGTHVANLWSDTGTLLGSATFANETASGWQQALFATPVPVTANTVYIASYHTNVGHYSDTFFDFAGNGFYRQPIFAIPDGLSGFNGVYAYGSGSNFPSQGFQASNYWVDVLFSPNAPQVTLSSLAVTPSNQTILSGSTLQLTATGTFSDGTTQNLTGLVTWSSSNTGVATVSGPGTASARGGGTTSVTASMSGIQGTTTLSVGTQVSIWPAGIVPGVIDSGPDSAVELGVRFTSDVAGFITGIRFYKASTNTGTHVANLWNSNGTLLATATFTGETASGWQLATFPTPVAISANTVYTASYHTSTGHYSDDQNYFASRSVDNPPLHALADGASGFNGVFAYGSGSSFPQSGWMSSNYWVDVVFRQ